MKKVWIDYYDRDDVGIADGEEFEPIIRVMAWDDNDNSYAFQIVTDQVIKVNLKAIQNKLNDFMISK